MYEKQRLELPTAKYLTHPRRMRLMVAMSPWVGCDRYLRLSTTYQSEIPDGLLEM